MTLLRPFVVALLGVALLVAACASFSTQAFRSEQTAVNLVFTTYVGYTQALANGTLKISVDQSNAVKQARLKFAGTVGVVESLRAAYATNSAVETQLQAAITTLSDQSSNVVFLINFIKAH